MLKIFIGYDSRECVTYHVLAHSILRRSTIPVSIAPLARQNMPFYRRERGALESTEFSITRFLVPFLCEFQGFALYLDCDMLCLGDVAEIVNYTTLMDSCATAVRVVKHAYTPEEDVKFLGNSQTRYERKNWSSAVLFNNRLCTALSLDYVQSAPGLDLHQFRWLQDERIQSLPVQWNWLVDEPGYEKGAPKLLHYTKGAPCFPAHKDCSWAENWREEREHMLSSG